MDINKERLWSQLRNLKCWCSVMQYQFQVMQGCCRHTTVGFELFTQLSALSNIPWPDSNFLFRTWHVLRIPTAYTTEAFLLRGFSSPLFQYHFCFQSHKPAQIYNLASNLSCPLTKWQHQLVSLVITEQLCQSNAAWKTSRTLLLRKMRQWVGAHDSLSLCHEFPLSIHSCKKAQRRSSVLHKGKETR